MIKAKKWPNKATQIKHLHLDKRAPSLIRCITAYSEDSAHSAYSSTKQVRPRERRKLETSYFETLIIRGPPVYGPELLTEYHYINVHQRLSCSLLSFQRYKKNVLLQWLYASYIVTRYKKYGSVWGLNIVIVKNKSFHKSKMVHFCCYKRGRMELF